MGQTAPGHLAAPAYQSVHRCETNCLELALILSTIAVMNHGDGASLGQGHVHGIEHELRLQVVAHGPADNAAGQALRGQSGCRADRVGLAMMFPRPWRPASAFKALAGDLRLPNQKNAPVSLEESRQHLPPSIRSS